MFHHFNNKGKSSSVKSLKDLTRTTSAEFILTEDKRMVLLEQIQEASALDYLGFNRLGHSLIINLVNHCQNLPETSNNYYSHPGGLLDYALNRTEAALGLFRQFIVQDDEKKELSEEQKLWQYALFSAAMLQGIGKLQIDYRIDVYDDSGHFIQQWNPLLNSLLDAGSYYTYEFQKESEISFRCRLNLLLARLLMPDNGFEWIASDLQVLAVWLALLNEDYYAAGTLGAILIRADAIALQRSFNQQLGRYGTRGMRHGRVGTFAGGSHESIPELEQQIGLEFLQWLTKSLASGQIMINKAPLFMVPGGMLMSVDIFKLFIREHPEFKNWQAIQNGFLSLGLHKMSADGQIISRFEQASNQKMHSGIIFSGYAVALPAEVQLQQMRSGKVSIISATELIYQAQFNHQFGRTLNPTQQQGLLHLAASGQWQAAHANTATAPSPSSLWWLNGV